LLFRLFQMLVLWWCDDCMFLVSALRILVVGVDLGAVLSSLRHHGREWWSLHLLTWQRLLVLLGVGDHLLRRGADPFGHHVIHGVRQRSGGGVVSAARLSHVSGNDAYLGSLARLAVLLGGYHGQCHLGGRGLDRGEAAPVVARGRALL